MSTSVCSFHAEAVNGDKFTSTKINTCDTKGWESIQNSVGFYITFVSVTQLHKTFTTCTCEHQRSSDILSPVQMRDNKTNYWTIEWLNNWTHLLSSSAVCVCVWSSSKTSSRAFPQLTGYCNWWRTCVSFLLGNQKEDEDIDQQQHKPKKRNIEIWSNTYLAVCSYELWRYRRSPARRTGTGALSCCWCSAGSGQFWDDRAGRDLEDPRCHCSHSERSRWVTWRSRHCTRHTGVHCSGEGTGHTLGSHWNLHRQTDRADRQSIFGDEQMCQPLTVSKVLLWSHFQFKQFLKHQKKTTNADYSAPSIGHQFQRLWLVQILKSDFKVKVRNETFVLIKNKKWKMVWC